MEQWLRDIDIELRRARETQHEGRLRTIARRIAGIALAEYDRRMAGAGGEASFMARLTACAEDTALPETVRPSSVPMEVISTHVDVQVNVYAIPAWLNPPGSAP